MKKKILTIIILLTSIFLSIENTFSSSGQYCNKNDPFCLEGKTKEDFKVGKLDTIATDWITYLLGFLGLVATIYGLYGAWQILSAMGDDEKIKKGKTIVIRSCLGLLVIFLAYPITKIVIGDGKKDSGLFQASGAVQNP